MGSACQLLGASVISFGNLSRNTMNLIGGDVLHTQVKELGVFLLQDLDDRQRLARLLPPYTPTVISTPSTLLLDKHLGRRSVKAYSIAGSRSSARLHVRNTIARAVHGRFHKAFLANDREDFVQIDTYRPGPERNAGRNGNTRPSIQKLGKVLIGSASALAVTSEPV